MTSHRHVPTMPSVRHTPEQLRDAGIAQRENAADPRLILAVDAVIARWIESGRRFSANEIRDEVPTLAVDLVGGRLRAASMRRPVELVKVGEVRSSLLSTHAKTIAVWQSARVATTPAPWTAFPHGYLSRRAAS